MENLFLNQATEKKKKKKIDWIKHQFREATLAPQPQDQKEKPWSPTSPTNLDVYGSAKGDGVRVSTIYCF